MLNPLLYNEILKACFTNKNVMDKAVQVVDERFFSGNMLYFIIYTAYKNLYTVHGCPTKEELIDEITLMENREYRAKKALENVDIYEIITNIYASNYNETLVLQKIQAAFIKSNFEDLISNSLEIADSSSNIIRDVYVKSKDLYTRAEIIVTPPEVKTSFLSKSEEDIVAAIKSYNTADDVIKTGWPLIDEILGHGVSRYGELMIYLAPPNRGKTAILLAHALNCLYLGHKCLFITGETTVPVLEKRLYAATAQIPINELSSNSDKVLKRYKMLKKLGGEIHFDSFVGNSFYTPADMEESIIRHKKKYGVEKVFVDYFDKMTVNRGSKTTEHRLKIAEITQEGRNIALRNYVPVITVSQTNRAGANTPLITEENIGEDFTKVAIADRIISLNSTYEDYTNNILRFFFLKNRDGIKNQLIEFHADMRSMIFRDTQLIDVNEYLRRHQAQMADRQRERNRARQAARQ